MKPKEKCLVDEKRLEWIVADLKRFPSLFFSFVCDTHFSYIVFRHRTESEFDVSEQPQTRQASKTHSHISSEMKAPIVNFAESIDEIKASFANGNDFNGIKIEKSKIVLMFFGLPANFPRYMGCVCVCVCESMFEHRLTG